MARPLGRLSFIYNIIQFSIVHTLSPSATAFGGNFNKAALVFLTLLLPFLRVHKLPGSPWIQLIWTAVIVNIAAFSYYSYLHIKAKEEAEKAAARKAAEEERERVNERMRAREKELEEQKKSEIAEIGRASCRERV